MIASRLLRNSSLYAIAGAIGKAAALGTVPYFTRSLGAEMYGFADLAISFAALLTLLARFGGEIPVARARALVEDPRERRRLLGTYVGAATVVSVGLIVALLPISPWISSTVWSSPASLRLAVLSLLLVPVAAIQLAQLTVLRLEDRTLAVVILSTIDLLAHVGFALLFVAFGLGADGLLGGHLLGGIVGATCASVVARRYVTIRWRWLEIRKLIARGLPFLPGFVAFLAADQIARVITVQGLGAASVGNLALAFRISSVMALASSAFSLAWGPMGLRMAVSDESRHIFRRTLHWYGLIALLSSLLVGVLAPELAVLLSGTGFIDASTAIPGLVWASALTGGLFILATAAGVTGQGSIVALSNSLGGLGQIAITLALVGSWGIAGVGFAAVVGRTAALSMLLHASRASLGLRLRREIPILVAAAGLILWVQQMNLTPSETLSIRIGVAALSTLSAGALMARIMSSNRHLLPRA